LHKLKEFFADLSVWRLSVCAASDLGTTQDTHEILSPL